MTRTRLLERQAAPTRPINRFMKSAESLWDRVKNGEIARHDIHGTHVNFEYGVGQTPQATIHFKDARPLTRGQENFNVVITVKPSGHEALPVIQFKNLDQMEHVLQTIRQVHRALQS